MNCKMKYYFMLIVMVSALGCKQEVQKENEKTNYKLLNLKEETRKVVSRYSAAIKGKQDIEIYPQISGYLSQVAVKEGEKVCKGDVLFVIEQTPFNAALKGAKAKVAISIAKVATAELNYENTLALRKKNIVSDSDLKAKENLLNNAKAQLELAKAEELSAQTELDFTVIKSPSNGIVGKLPYRRGALVSPTLIECLTVVSDNSEMNVYFSMNENQILALIEQYGSLDSIVAKMPKIDLQLNNGSIYEEKGYIESISGVIEDNTGAVSIRAVFPNQASKLLSGGVGNVLISEEHQGVIVIPKTATYEMQDKVCVYQVVDNMAKSKIVEVIQNSNDKEYIVEKGLEKSDVIIAEGAGLVLENAPVNQ
ncbi:efflux RND transporter periplasmic adaptor subunit [Puteibacter caeruleilacunae]|nr:efflux RND transporter periplasmic adaptor subunit [Puteibacter caeruleilacunae]